MYAEALAGMDLQERLIARAGQCAAAQCQLLVDLAEFDATGGYGPWECRSAAHWLMWRCGEGTASAWDKLRVARALGGLAELVHPRPDIVAGPVPADQRVDGKAVAEIVDARPAAFGEGFDPAHAHPTIG